MAEVREYGIGRINRGVVHILIHTTDDATGWNAKHVSCKSHVTLAPDSEYYQRVTEMNWEKDAPYCWQQVTCKNCQVSGAMMLADEWNKRQVFWGVPGVKELSYYDGRERN